MHSLIILVPPYSTQLHILCSSNHNTRRISHYRLHNPMNCIQHRFGNKSYNIHYSIFCISLQIWKDSCSSFRSFGFGQGYPSAVGPRSGPGSDAPDVTVVMQDPLQVEIQTDEQSEKQAWLQDTSHHQEHINEQLVHPSWHFTLQTPMHFPTQE